MTAEHLLRWFEASVAPYLENYAPERLPLLLADAKRLKEFRSKPRETVICFLGNSAVGKSTLLNALAAGDKSILPAGGIGPLTALATEVRYAPEPHFKVRYHGTNMLWRLGFALERRLVVQQRQSESAQPDAGTWDLPEAERAEIISQVADVEVNNSGSDGDGGRPSLEALQKQAQLLVTGDQYEQRSLDYLVDAIRIACRMKPQWGSEINLADRERLHRIGSALGYAKEKRAYERREIIGVGEGQHFAEDLRDHVGGFLAPLIERIEVGWPSILLKDGIVLVDLPGVGVADDRYREATAHYVRERARGLILVVDRAGLSEAAQNLLRTSGYFDRLVGASDDLDSDFCAMMVAVTRVDDLADAEYQGKRDLYKKQGKRKRDVFAELMPQLRARIREQITTQLVSLPTSDDDAVRTARMAARERMLSDLQIHPVSAPEFRRLLADDEDDPPLMLNEVAQTGVPGLQDSLRQLASSHRNQLDTRTAEVEDRLAASIASELDRIRSYWTAEQRADEEATRLRVALDAFVEPKRQEYVARLGAFREFLDSTDELRVAELVFQARTVAEKEVRAYLRELRDVNWATLRAAVRRGGAWLHGRGRQIDLPNDIAGYFQEPMAAVWSQRLLLAIRERTRRLGGDVRSIVGEIAQWAEENAGDLLQAELVAAQRQRVATQVAQMDAVGEEAIDELRKIVKAELTKAIIRPIQEACEDFITRGEDRGAGVKNRILNLFEDLADQATVAAAQPAKRILHGNFTEVRMEVLNAFGRLGDPVSEMADMIVERHEERVKRADVERRTQILTSLEIVSIGNPAKQQSANIEA